MYLFNYLKYSDWIWTVRSRKSDSPSSITWLWVLVDGMKLESRITHERVKCDLSLFLRNTLRI